MLAGMLPLCAGAAGNVWGMKTASTEHFDIIYRDENIETASLLYNSCEDVYASLVEFFGDDPGIHIPVVVTSEYKQLNAYYTAYPANHIVMFDTVPLSGMLSNYQQTIVSVFRHELTHAFQFNYRGPFMNVVSRIFGDPISLAAMFYLYPSLIEGGAVLSESTDGYGRLNDSYAMQIVKQAKLEGLFPNWFQIAGSRDTYPTNLLSYNFAAAFLEYLCITYGYDTIADIYVRFKYPRWLATPGDVIKEKTGKTVQEAWEDFYNWVEVPDAVAEALPLESRTQNGKYGVPVLADDGYVYIYDSAVAEVLRFGNDLQSYTSILRLPTADGSISVSSDGTRLLIPIVDQNKSSVRLYDISSPSGARLLHEFRSDDIDYRGGCFVREGLDEYILLYGNCGQNTYLDLHTLSTFAPVGKGTVLGFDVHAYCLTTLPDGNAAFILSRDAGEHIAILSVGDMSLKVLDNPSDISIRSLSAGTDGRDDVLSFTWYPSDAKSSNLGRYGEIVLSDGSYIMRLAQTDILGSMTKSVRNGDTILFPVQYYERSDLRTVSASSLYFTEPVELGLSEHTVPHGPDTSALSAASSKYHAIRYYFDGILMPFASVSIGSTSFAGLGLTWTTQDPTETYTHTASAGYLAGNLMGSYSFTSSNLPVTYSITLNTVYGTGWAKTRSEETLADGQMISTAEVQAKWSTYLGHSNQAVSVIGDYGVYVDYLPGEDLWVSDASRLQLVYGLVVPKGANYYDKFALYVDAYLLNLQPGIKFELAFPRLLWWRCDGPDVTNLPFRMVLDAVADPGLKGLTLSGSAYVVLYSREIQWAPAVFGLYFRRAVLDASYNITYATASNALTEHSLMLSAVGYISPVIGDGLTNMSVGLGVSLVKDLLVGWNEGWKVKMYFGIQ